MVEQRASNRRQEDFHELEASLIYIVGSRTARTTQRPCLKKQKSNKRLSGDTHEASWPALLSQ